MTMCDFDWGIVVGFVVGLLTAVTVVALFGG